MKRTESGCVRESYKLHKCRFVDIARVHLYLRVTNAIKSLALKIQWAFCRMNYIKTHLDFAAHNCTRMNNKTDFKDAYFFLFELIFMIMSKNKHCTAPSSKWLFCYVHCVPVQINNTSVHHPFWSWWRWFAFSFYCGKLCCHCMFMFVLVWSVMKSFWSTTQNNPQRTMHT